MSGGFPVKRLFGITTLAAIALLACCFLFLPQLAGSERFRVALEAMLGRALHGEVRLGRLALDFSSGIRVEGLQWIKDGVPRLVLDRLLLDVAWSELPLGRLVVRELRISDGRLTASQQDLAPQEAEAPAKAPASGFSLPAIFPLALELRSVRLEGIDLDFTYPPSQRLHLRNLALSASARADREGLELQGTLDIATLTFSDAKGSLSLPVDLVFDLGGDFGWRGLRARHSALRLGDLTSIPLEIQINTAYHPYEMFLTTRAEPISLAPILALVQPWLPEAWNPCTLTGRLEPWLTIAGRWDADGWHGQATGGLTAAGLNADLPNLAIQVTDGQAQVTLKWMEWYANLLRTLSAEVSVKAVDAAWDQEGLRDFSLLAVSDYHPDGRVDGHMRLRAERTAPRLPFETIVLASSEPRSDSYHLHRLMIKAGDWLHLVGEGDLARQPGQRAGWHLEGRLHSTWELSRLLELLPPAWLQETGVAFAPGASRLRLEGRVGMDAHGMPRDMELGGAATLAPWRVALAGGEYSGTGTRLAWRANQAVTDGPVRARLRGNAALTRNATALPELSIALQGEGDPANGVYRVERLRLGVARELTATLAGRYQAKDEQFEASGSVDPVDLVRLGERFDLAGQPWYAMAQPRGRVGLRFNAAGRLAELAQLDGRSWPLQADVQLMLADLAGQWGGWSVEEANGVLQAATRPQEPRRIRLSGDLRARPRPFFMEGGGPVKLLFDVTGQELEQWRLNQVRAVLPGLVLDASGGVAGTGRLLRGEGGIANLLTPLLVDVTGKARADSGPVTEWSLFKAARGPVTARLTLDPNGLSWKGEGVFLQRAAGKVSGVKTLWLTGPPPATSSSQRRAFALERLATPASWSASDRRLRIDALEIAGVKAEEIGLDLSFHEETIRGSHLEMRLLGGRIGGNLLVDAVRPGRIDAVLEGVGIDLNQLLPEGERLARDSSVDCVARLALRFEKESGKLSWGRSEMSLIFTRIGREALDRLLLALDPRESNPALVNARSKVAYANPASLDLQLAKGTVKLRIEFASGLISSLNVERIPLGVLGRFERIGRELVPLENLMRLLTLAGTTHLQLEAHENTPAP
ncbi:MAG: hypothetical protein HQL96_09750 [Magnetococcales bacterium]|nr:hypothetical protein [Magnetococcales bacterium]